MSFPIDHLFTVTRRREAARAALARLGFTLTERGEHPGRGTSNHLMFFGRCYWELLSIDELSPGNQMLLAHAHTLAGCALRTRDAAQDAAAAQRAGAQSQGIESITRPVSVAGEWKTARFTIAPLTLPDTVQAHFFFCQHLTPELVWPREAPRHANGAFRLQAVHVAGPDAAVARETLGPLLGEGGGEEPQIVYASGAASGVRLAALQFQVRDLSDTLSHLYAQGVIHRRERDQITVDSELIGHSLIFRA